jgi:predicted SAM-dependent methyltransferase
MADAKSLVKELALNARRFVRMFQKLDREAVATNFLKGEGLEIGGLHNPLRVPSAARVRYVDRMSVEDLRRQYPELGSLPLVRVDIIDDGEKLSTVADVSQDFVIANHFFEHCQDPVQTVRNLLRVLRVGGILYFAIPDKRYTFDVERPVTPFKHIVRDHEEGPAWSKEEHFREWVRYVDAITDPAAAEERYRALVAQDYSIHFHVWTQDDLLELIIKLRTYFRLPVELELFLKHAGRGEVIAILSKTVPI